MEAQAWVPGLLSVARDDQRLNSVRKEPFTKLYRQASEGGRSYIPSSLTDCITTLVEVLATKGRLEIFSPSTCR